MFSNFASNTTPLISEQQQPTTTKRVKAKRTKLPSSSSSSLSSSSYLPLSPPRLKSILKQPTLPLYSLDLPPSPPLSQPQRKKQKKEAIIIEDVFPATDFIYDPEYEVDERARDKKLAAQEEKEEKKQKGNKNVLDPSFVLPKDRKERRKWYEEEEDRLWSVREEREARVNDEMYDDLKEKFMRLVGEERRRARETLRRQGKLKYEPTAQEEHAALEQAYAKLCATPNLPRIKKRKRVVEEEEKE
jgi:hypothetical protein